jgi:hypothetical protein
MADGDKQAAYSNKTAEAKRPGIKRVFMVHLDIECMGIQKIQKNLP